MSKVLFVTVGTTAISNEKIGKGAENFEALRECRARYMNEPKQRQVLERKLLPALLEAHRLLWRYDKYSAIMDKPEHTSAEMTSTYLLLMSREERFPNELDPKTDTIVLLTSDTAEGRLCARVNAELMHEFLIRCPCGGRPCKSVEELVVTGLEANTFSVNVSEAVTGILNSRSKGRDAFCNITGGYKGTIPAITCWARDELIPLFYQHVSHRTTTLVDFDPRTRKLVERTSPPLPLPNEIA